MYKTVNADCTVELVVNKFFSVTCADTFNRCEVEWVVHSWGQCHWDVWGIDVTSVKQAGTVVSHDKAPMWCVWVYDDLITTLEATDFLNTHVVSVALCASVSYVEVFEVVQNSADFIKEIRNTLENR